MHRRKPISVVGIRTIGRFRSLPQLEQGPPICDTGNHDGATGSCYFWRLQPQEPSSRRISHQRRSYFARWLTRRLSRRASLGRCRSAQRDYFSAIARMPAGTRHPGGPVSRPAVHAQVAYKSAVIDYVGWIAPQQAAGKIPLVLSGDTHHCSRHRRRFLTQSPGGGGAFRIRPIIRPIVDLTSEARGSRASEAHSF